MKWLLLTIGGLLLLAKPSAALHIIPVKAITNERWEMMPHRFGSDPVPTIYLKGCRGQRLNAAFYIVDGNPAEQLMVKSEWPEVCDLRWIKWWWQAGRTNFEADRPQYIPELLLHDGDLVHSSPFMPRVNTYPDIPQDAFMLQPLDCDDHAFMPGFEQGVMLTITIPKDQATGDYPFLLRVSAKDRNPVIVPIHLDVYPFDLPEPPCDYSMYYRARLNTGEPGIDPEWRTHDQMQMDLYDFVVHGVRNPCSSVGESQLDDVLTLRDEAGCDNRRFFTGAVVGPQALAWNFDSGMWPQLKRDTEVYAQRIVAECVGYGVEKVYAYCKDEAQRAGIRKQTPLWKAARKAGLNIYGFVGALSEKQLLSAKEDLQNVVVRSGAWPTRETTEALENVDIYMAGGPGGGTEEPDSHRRSQGLCMFNRPWIKGSMVYAYMHVWVGAKHPWDDFGCPEGDHYRSHMMAYPTIDGVVDTLQWEGYSEGVVDMQYLERLRMEHSREGQLFFKRLSQEEYTTDLDAMRDEAARLIQEAM